MEKDVVHNRDGVETKKQKEEEEEEHSREVVLPNLPLIIICEILSWLDMEDIMRCRCVCKTWCDLPKDPSFIYLHSSRSQISKHPPYLVAVGLGWDREQHIQSLLPKSNGRLRGMKIPISGIYIASCNGLICIAQFYHYVLFIIYNPITREKFILPEFLELSKYLGTGFKCGFGFEERNNNYKLILEFPRGPDVVAIITIGQSSWRNLDVPSGIKEFFDKRMGTAVFFNGGFHWIFGSKFYNLSVEGILTLDIITEQFQTINFSHPLDLLHPAEPIQLGSSIALFHQNNDNIIDHDHEPKVIKIWKILGVNGDGSCDYQFQILKLTSKNILFHNSYHFELLDILSNGDFLFRAWNSKCCNRLVVYDQEKDEPSFVVELAKVPSYVKIGTFVPTLISPPRAH